MNYYRTKKHSLMVSASTKHIHSKSMKISFNSSPSGRSSILSSSQSLKKRRSFNSFKSIEKRIRNSLAITASPLSEKNGVDSPVPLRYFVTIASQQDKKPKKSGEDYYKEHLESTFSALNTIKRLPSLSLSHIHSKKVKLLKKDDRKTVIFDLDETLVHCCEPGEPADVYLPILMPNGSSMLTGVNIRPYAREVLAAAQAMFEVIVFTASHQSYADIVLDYLDPHRNLINHRLYRDSCIYAGAFYLKDLRIFDNRKLSHTVIVDNLVLSFAFQLDNGIPIISWFDDKEDKELLNLIDYLKVLHTAEDVRTINRDTFRLQSFDVSI